MSGNAREKLLERCEPLQMGRVCVKFGDDLALDHAVVVKHEPVIGGAPDVDFYPVGAGFGGGADAGKSVFGVAVPDSGTEPAVANDRRPAIAAKDASVRSAGRLRHICTVDPEQTRWREYLPCRCILPVGRQFCALSLK